MKKEWGADLKKGVQKKKLHIGQKLSVGPWSTTKEGGQLLLLPLVHVKTPTTTSSLQNLKTSNVHQISQTKIPF